MAAKDTIKLNVNNLVPDEKYVIQVRAVAGGEESDWSQKLHFKTVSDAQANGGPTVPQNVLWESTADALVASWDSVTENVNGTAAKVAKYEIELSSTGFVNQSAVLDGGGSRVERAFSVATIYSMYQGAIPDVINMRVRTQNSGGSQSAWTAPLSINVGKPDPPTDAVPPPTAASVIDAVALNWTPPVNLNNVAGYRVYVSLTPGFTPNGTNRIYQGAAPAAVLNSSTYQMHYFVIRAYSLFGKESDDLLAQAAPRSPFGSDTIPPPVPTNIVAGIVRDGPAAKGTLTWDWTDDDPLDVPLGGFSIRYRKTGTSLWDIYDAPFDARAAQFDLANPFSDYEAQISARDLVGNFSAYMPVSPVTISGAVPGPPPQTVGVTVAANLLDGITLTWTPSTALDVIHGGTYRVQFATNSGFTTGLIEYITGDTQITVSGLQPSTTYYYRVQAIDTSNTAGAYSTTASVVMANFPTVKSDGAVPPVVGTVTVVPGIGYLSVSWPAVTNADAVTYELHMSTTSGFTATPGNASTLVAQGNSTSQIVRNTAAKAALVYDTTYYIKIIAKDADGAAAASAQGSGAPVKGGTFDIAELSVAKLTGGSVTGEEFIIATGGSLRTSNSDVIITSTGIQVGANSTISAAAMQAGTAFVDALTVSSTFTLLGGNAFIQSSNYSAVGDGAGFQLHAGGLDIRSGVIWANTLKGGTISAATIKIGTGGILEMDSTGVIKSNNWASGSTGWRISSTGIEMNDANSSIKANAIKAGTFTGGNFIVGSGGAVHSSNWNGSVGWHLDYQGLTIRQGTIQSATVITDQLHSEGMVDDGGGTQRYRFDINSGGYAMFTGAQIFGNTIVSGAAHHRIQTSNYSAGGAGWAIRGDGTAELNNLRVGGGGKDWIYGTSEISGDSRAYLRFINGSNGEIKGDLKSYNNGIELAARFGPSIQMDAGNATVTGGFIVNQDLYTVGTITANTLLRSNNNITCGADINIGSMPGGGGDRVVRWDNDGWLRFLVSSRRYKNTIEDLDVTAESVLALDPKTYYYNDGLGSDGVLQVGFIAEQAHEVGLQKFVGYTELDGETVPDYFKYETFVAAQQVVLRAHRDEIAELKTRLEQLESALDK